MFFGDIYDKSLYLILKSNRKIREQLVDFINLIPDEFNVKIRDSVIEYIKYIDEGINKNDGNKKYFNSEIYTNDGYLYSFYIDVNTGILSVSRSIYQYGSYYKEMEISLCSFNEIDNYEKKNIGKICYGFNNNIDSYKNNYLFRLRECNYDVINIPYKNILLLFENNMFVGIDRMDMNNINNDIIKNKRRCLRKD